MNKFMATDELELTDGQLELVNGATDGTKDSFNVIQSATNYATNVGYNTVAVDKAHDVKTEIDQNQWAKATSKQWYSWS